MKKKLIIVAALAGLTLTSTGCRRALGLEDWQRDILSIVASAVGGFIANQSTNVTVERECFENGMAVDCSTLP